MAQWVKCLHVKAGLEVNVCKPEPEVMVKQVDRRVLLGCLERKL